MTYNDKIQPDPAFLLYTQDHPNHFHPTSESSDFEANFPFRSNQTKLFSGKASSLRGKQNQCQNSNYLSNKNIVTNHSFNGFFNENNQKGGKKVNDSIKSRMGLSEIGQQSCKVSNQTNFTSSGKFSNLKFVGDSNSQNNYKQLMHEEVNSFMEKYFPDIELSGNYQGQYLSLHDFVHILFQQFDNLIGNQHSLNLFEEFTDKIFLLFGDKVYFEPLIRKTTQNGLTGLILELVKAIDQEKTENQQSNANKLFSRHIQSNKPKTLLGNSTFSRLNADNAKNQPFKEAMLQNSKMKTWNSSKISLDKFFGSATSKTKYHQDSRVLSENSIGTQDDDLEEVKTILEDYIQSMYEEAEQKLNKKFNQEIKKITLKYKETQKLLEKINEKISNHYDTIELHKEFQKKIKLLTEKENHLQTKINNYELQLKQAKGDLDKEKTVASKMDQEMIKLKEKLEKYQNAIFQKALQKTSSQNPISLPSIPNDQPVRPNQIYQNFKAPVYQQKVVQKPKFELKIDTFTQSRIISPMLSPHSSYSPYLSRPVTPTRIKQLQRTSVSPMGQKISFVKTHNPLPNGQTPTNQKQATGTNQQGRTKNSNLTTSRAQDLRLPSQIEVGEKIQLRPLSPIGRMNDLNLNLNGLNQASSSSRGQLTPSNSQPNYQPSNRSYSPIKVQFCASRVSPINVQNR